MSTVTERIVGRKIKGTRVVPLVTKIIILFTLFLLASSFVTNYINLTLNQGQQIQLLNQLLVKGLKDLYLFCTNQFEIYSFNQDLEGAIAAMADKGKSDLKRDKSTALGVRADGEILFQSYNTTPLTSFTDRKALNELVEAIDSGTEGGIEGSLTFTYEGAEYRGVYKYNPKWDVFLIRAEELGEFLAESRDNFRNISLAIIAIAFVCAVVGAFLVGYILRFVRHITDAIMRMQEDQNLELIDLEKAPNDDVTYLGVAFNALSSEIRNLMNIFRKFATQDVVTKAYRERHIRLEGRQEELTILFSDIKSFTFITETLGTDIIKLLNLHYENAIEFIHKETGIIGSIIGDALLAIFGTIPSKENKAVHAIKAGYRIQEVASQLREQMHQRREEIVKQRGGLSSKEEEVYKAVLLEVGVGIDGGPVFYGNIGSSSRMTNTVIGDNVNAASRLEGLTRVYKVPIICSESVKEELEGATDDFELMELDQVQVKGKTIAKKIFWPIPRENIDEDFRKDIEVYGKGLKTYYDGQWARANAYFNKCSLAAAEEFRSRTVNTKRPRNWNGVWTMSSK